MPTRTVASWPTVQRGRPAAALPSGLQRCALGPAGSGPAVEQTGVSADKPTAWPSARHRHGHGRVGPWGGQGGAAAPGLHGVGGALGTLAQAWPLRRVLTSGRWPACARGPGAFCPCPFPGRSEAATPGVRACRRPLSCHLPA